MNIFVGNLANEVTEEELKKEFLTFGEVSKVSIIVDKYSGQPRGFAFVEMPVKSQAIAALTGLKGKKFYDRTIEISEARPRLDSRGTGGGGGRSGVYGNKRGGFGGKGRSGFGGRSSGPGGGRRRY